jgi:hypothetical protein
MVEACSRIPDLTDSPVLRAIRKSVLEQLAKDYRWTWARATITNSIHHTTRIFRGLPWDEKVERVETAIGIPTATSAAAALRRSGRPSSPAGS